MPHRWCNSAELRRVQIESGLDLTFNEVFKPIFLEHISGLHPSRVLEVGAGTGHLSKELSYLGFHVTAIEPSRGMFEVATDVLRGCNVNLINCTSFDLPESDKFDIAYSHLVAHVIEDLLNFLNSISRHLVVGSHLIFSIPHPCFYNNYKKLFGDEYGYMKPMSKNVSFNITRDPVNAITDVPYHHRPLSDYINTLIKAHFVIDRLDEIFPTQEIQNKYGAKWNEPRYCIFMCRKVWAAHHPTRKSGHQIR